MKLKKYQSEEYVYYTVYSMDKSTWDALVRKYLMDLMGTEGLETETQKKIGALFTEMKEDADKKDAQKQAEEEALYKAQLARIDAEKAKANAEIAASNAEVAKANQATAEAGLKAKELDTREAQTKAAVEAATELASFLL